MPTINTSSRNLAQMLCACPNLGERTFTSFDTYATPLSWVLLDRVGLLMHRFAQVSLEQAISILSSLLFPTVLAGHFFCIKPKTEKKQFYLWGTAFWMTFILFVSKIKLLWEKTGQTETLIDTVTFKWWQAWRLDFRTCGRAPCRDCRVRQYTSGASRIMLIILLHHRKSFIAA